MQALLTRPAAARKTIRAAAAGATRYAVLLIAAASPDRTATVRSELHSDLGVACSRALSIASAAAAHPNYRAAEVQVVDTECNMLAFSVPCAAMRGAS